MLPPTQFDRSREIGHRSAGARRARIVLCIVSLAIYVALSLLHNQNNESRNDIWAAYAIERTPMASAVSHIVYGAPLASVYAGLFQEFVRPAASIETLLEKAKSKEIEPSRIIPYTPDGIGAGEAIFATAAMSVFGIQASSLLWSFLTLMTVAVVAFVLRFQDSRALIAVAGLSALIFIFASQLGTATENISQFPVGGYRYFSLLAAIPGMHIFLELINNETATSRRQVIVRWLLLFVQFTIFAIVLYVNIAAIYLYGLFAFGTAYALYRARRDGAVRVVKLRKVIVIVGLVGATLVASKVVTPHAYRATGRSGDMIWHRVFIGMGANPHWPFGSLAEEYKGCWPPEMEKTINPGIADYNGHCVWNAYALQHHMSGGESAAHVYDGQYNKVLRNELIRIANQYPRETLLTFIYYKPLMLRDTLLSLFTFTDPLPGWTPLLVMAQFLVLFAFALVEAQSSSRMAVVFISLALGAISTCGLYIVAWSFSSTTGDLFFYLLALSAGGVVALLSAVGRLLLPKVSGLAHAEANPS
jgi:hypothetical protein